MLSISNLDTHSQRLRAWRDSFKHCGFALSLISWVDRMSSLHAETARLLLQARALQALAGMASPGAMAVRPPTTRPGAGGAQPSASSAEESGAPSSSPAAVEEGGTAPGHVGSSALPPHPPRQPADKVRCGATDCRCAPAFLMASCRTASTLGFVPEPWLCARTRRTRYLTPTIKAAALQDAQALDVEH